MTAHELSSDELIDQISRYQLVEPEPLWQYLAGRGGAAALPPGGAAVAAEMVRDGLLTAFQADALSRGAGRTLSVGKYRLLAQLGGPSSSVYLGERRPSGPDRVAVKVFSLPGSTPAEVARFQAEGEALARLEHPGFVAVKDVGEDEGRLFFVMEYVEGRTLPQLVAQQRQLAPVPAARLIHAAAEALAHLHKVGMVHRDLRPEHIMQDERGGVRLLDLGRVRFLDDPAGRPPRDREADAADIRADTGALGAALYFLLAGRPPSSQGTGPRRSAGAAPRPERLLHLRPDVPRPLLAVVERMMTENAELRYHTAVEAAAALGAWLAEVAPPPLQQPKRSSAQGTVVRPSAIDDLCAEVAPGRTEPEHEASSVGPLLALLAAGVAVALLAVLAVWLLG